VSALQVLETLKAILAELDARPVRDVGTDPIIPPTSLKVEYSRSYKP
jgi:hypothetical protein